MYAAADGDSAEVTSEVTSPSLQSDSVTVSAADDVEMNEADSDVADRQTTDHSATHVDRSDIKLAIITNLLSDYLYILDRHESWE